MMFFETGDQLQDTSRVFNKKIKQPEFAQILDPYKTTLREFAQIKLVLFGRVNAPLRSYLGNNTFSV